MPISVLRRIEEERVEYIREKGVLRRKVRTANLELVIETPEVPTLEHPPSIFWLEDNSRVKNQSSYFTIYNPRLKEVLDELDSLREVPRVKRNEIEELFGLGPGVIGHYLGNTGRDLKVKYGVEGKKRLPLDLAYELAARFMPVIEQWPKIGSAAVKLGVHKSAIEGRRLNGDIETVKVNKRVYVSPLSISSLRSRLKKIDERELEIGGKRYYSLSRIVEDALNARGIDLEDTEQKALYLKRFSYLIKSYPTPLPHIRFHSRKFIEEKTKDILVDLITPGEMFATLGISKARCYTLLRKGLIKSYNFGGANWVSRSSTMDYLQATKKKVEPS